jgi:hypothetical protein
MVSLPITPDGAALVRIWREESARWGVRSNKGRNCQEIFRHDDLDVVSPVVIETHPFRSNAAPRMEDLRDAACIRAVLAAVR